MYFLHVGYLTIYPVGGLVSSSYDTAPYIRPLRLLPLGHLPVEHLPQGPLRSWIYAPLTFAF